MLKEDINGKASDANFCLVLYVKPGQQLNSEGNGSPCLGVSAFMNESAPHPGGSPFEGADPLLG